MIQVYTGNGKGKTTAALGLIVRALGQGKKICLIQFMKKDFHYGEIKFLSSQQNLDIFQFGTDKLIDPDKPGAIDHKEASAAINKAYDVLTEERYNLVILDEINVAVKWGLIGEKEQLKIFELAGETEVIMTGRYAPDSVVEKADLVTEMKEVKHYYKKGVKARPGIEY